MSTIKLTEKQWQDISAKITQDYSKATLLIRPVMQRELGFVTRNHRYWKPAESTGVYDGYGDYVVEVHLDFYDEVKETMFRLKYL